MYFFWYRNLKSTQVCDEEDVLYRELDADENSAGVSSDEEE